MPICTFEISSGYKGMYNKVDTPLWASVQYTRHFYT